MTIEFTAEDFEFLENLLGEKRYGKRGYRKIKKAEELRLKEIRRTRMTEIARACADAIS